MKKRLLITGASGMLGQRVYNKFITLSDNEIFTIGRIKSTNKNHIICDIAEIDKFNYFLDEIKPHVIIHCAANVNLEDCESNKEYAYHFHVSTAELISSKKYVEQSVYVSTDSVFDGVTGNYDESDPVNPLNYYAQTKMEAEFFFLNKARVGIILRTNMLGYSIPMKNSFFEWAYKSISEGIAINGFTDVIFNPLYTSTIADIVYTVLNLNLNKSSIYHLGTTNSISKYDLLKKIVFKIGANDAAIGPLLLSNTNTKIRRPLNTTLNTKKISQQLNVALPTIEEELDKMFKDLNSVYDYKRI